MPAPPPISVIIPVRDGADNLAEAIESLETQSMSDFEVIAIDDGSTDRTPHLLREWAGRDPRVTVLTQPPGGIVPALERGRSAASGRYLARMDADDIALPGRLAAQFEMAEGDPSLAVVGGRVEYFPRDRVRDGALRYEAWLNASSAPEEVEREIFVECPLAHPTFFLRSEAVEAIGGYRDTRWAEDYDLILRLWQAGGRLAKVPETVLRWREGEDRLSRTDPRYGLGRFRACKLHYLIEAFGLHRRRVLIWGAGPVGKSISRDLEESGVERVAFAEVDPRKIGQEIHGIPVLDTSGALAHREVLHLAAVGQPGARDTLRSLLREAGFVEMRDFVAVA